MDKQKTPYHYKASDMLKQLRKGAFLTTKVNDEINTMTIAWGGLNIVWNKEIFVVYVRYTRHTYHLLEQVKEFTISVPTRNNLSKELGYCGSKSGRDTNKIKDCDFTMIPGKSINTPIIKECDMHYECNVIYQQAMEPENVLDEVKDKYYKEHDYHVIYYGEIVDSYQLKGE